MREGAGGKDLRVRGLKPEFVGRIPDVAADAVVVGVVRLRSFHAAGAGVFRALHQIDPVVAVRRLEGPQGKRHAAVRNAIDQLFETDVGDLRHEVAGRAHDERQYRDAFFSVVARGRERRGAARSIGEADGRRVGHIGVAQTRRGAGGSREHERRALFNCLDALDGTGEQAVNDERVAGDVGQLGDGSSGHHPGSGAGIECGAGATVRCITKIDGGRAADEELGGGHISVRAEGGRAGEEDLNVGGHERGGIGQAKCHGKEECFFHISLFVLVSMDC